MVDPVAAYKAAMKQAKDDAIAAEKNQLTQFELTNPCLFDTKLKFVVTKLLYTNLYKKDNPFCNLFELQNIQTWEGFLAMYQGNLLSVYTDRFPFKDKDGNMITGPDGDPVTTTLYDSQAALLLMLYMYGTQWIRGTPARHNFTVDLVAMANHPTTWNKNDVYQLSLIHI